VVLAAGAGSRYSGPTHKLLAPLRGSTVVRLSIDAAVDSGVGEVVVITGCVDIGAVRPGVTVTPNPDWRSGQRSSVLLALDVARRHGVEAIVVGIWSGADRQRELSPFGGGRGEAYLEFLVKTVRPLVNRTFRARRERRHTGILGSSLGGLISTYAMLRYPQIFGLLGAFSPSYWAGRGAIYRILAHAPAPPGRAYFDNSVHETSARRMVNHFRRDFGYTLEVDLRYVEDPDGAHDESAWAARFPAAVRFLLGE